jgi:hypothetical protein
VRILSNLAGPLGDAGAPAQGDRTGEQWESGALLPAFL